MGDEPPDDEAALRIDPFADLLFTLVATVMPAVLLLLPAAQDAPAPLPDRPIRIEGRPAALYVARADGLRLGGPEARLVPLDAIPDDLPLRARLADAAVGPLLLLVEPEGGEAAFLFEGVLARAGVARIRQVRIAPTCGGPALRGCAP